MSAAETPQPPPNLPCPRHGIHYRLQVVPRDAWISAWGANHQRLEIISPGHVWLRRRSGCHRCFWNCGGPGRGCGRSRLGRDRRRRVRSGVRCSPVRCRRDHRGDRPDRDRRRNRRLSLERKSTGRLGAPRPSARQLAVKPQPQCLGGDFDTEAAQRDGQHLDGIAVATQPQQFLAVRLKLRCLRLLRVARFCDQLGERRWWCRSDIVVCKW